MPVIPPFQNDDNFYIWEAIKANTVDVSGLALETTLQGLWDGQKDGSGQPAVFKDNLDQSAFINASTGQAWLAHLDITQTAQANLLKGISNKTLTDLFVTLSDIDAYTQGNYAAINALSTRIQGSLCTTGTYSNADLSTLITNTNAAIQAGNPHLLGPVSFVYDGALWHSFYTGSIS